MPGKQVERRRDERGEGAEVWNDDDRKVMLKLGSLFEKWNNRKGKQKEPDEKKSDKTFLELLGIK